MRVLVAMLLLFVGMSGCDLRLPKTSPKETRSNGGLQGVVTDLETGERLAGVEVAVLVNGSWRHTQTTRDNTRTLINEAGTYYIKDLPVGVALRVWFGGPSELLDEQGKLVEGPTYATFYQTFRIDPILNGRDGNGTETELLLADHPLLQLDATLVQATAIFGGRVLGDESGDQAGIGGALVRLIMPRFELTRDVLTEEDGSFEFLEVPRSTIGGELGGTLMVLPIDRDGDGRYEYATWMKNPATIISLTSTGLDTAQPFVIDMQRAALKPEVVWTNVPELPAATGEDPTARWRYFEVSQELRFLFSIPMVSTSANASLVELRLLDESDDTAGGRQVGVNTSFDEAGVLLTVEPVEELVPGRRYTVTLAGEFEAVSGGRLTAHGYGFLGHAGLPVLQPEDAPTLSRFLVDFTLDWNTTAVTLMWSEVPGATSYLLFARDHHVGWREILPVAGETLIVSDGYAYMRVDLSSFDVYPDDGNLFTPFASDNELSVVIVPINRDGVWNFPSKPDQHILKLYDETKPTVVAVTTVELDGSAKVGRLRIEFSEAMDHSKPPTVACTDKSGDTKAPSGGSWTWVYPAVGSNPPLLTEGYFTFLNEDKVNFSTDQCTITYTGVKDSSGNALASPEKQVHIL
ncbi:MAG: hypothetical protein A2284_14690 [Deltaproteobacteria bacterium RIFOXYA12_FULL_61_11]|nr:MAG: hypothetical protein A2284_14690 [Deltaproteobacteria bacterium RIFOXYA12_FULL_61_11]